MPYGSIENGRHLVIALKFGKDSYIVEAVNKLEAKPDSEGRKAKSQKEVAVSKASDDKQLLQIGLPLKAAKRYRVEYPGHITKCIACIKFCIQLTPEFCQLP